MFVDASALTAILAKETDAAQLLERMNAHSERATSPLAVWETVLAIARILHLDVSDARDVVERFLRLANIEVRAVPAEARFLALDAFARFGKGRHPAALNFGDCFAYACALHAGEPLLYKGADFARTDIAAA
jgi:ribonuclease VapC